jgi:acyl-CoA synthetase (AMP-forming)/AMP-acid ligase II
MSTAPRIGYAPGVSPRNNVIQFLEEHRAARPEHAALLAPDPAARSGWTPGAPLPHTAVPIATLAARVESAAAGLARLGIGRGDRVFVFVPMSVDLYVAMFAVQRLGAIAVFLDSWARRDQLGQCAAQVKPRGFIGPAPAFALLEGVPALADVPVRVVTRGGPRAPEPLEPAVPGGSLEALANAGERCPICPVAMEDTALVTFTTGSSGAPKGANRTHRFLAAQHAALEACLPYGPHDTDLPVFPIFSLNNLAGGVTTVLPALDLARPSEQDGALLLAQLEATAATSCTLSPSLLRGLCAAARAAGRPLERLRRVAAGGAPIGADDVAALQRAAPRAALHILYGSTEVEPIAHLVATPAAFTGGEGVCVGRLSQGLEAKFLRLSRDPIELGPAGWSEWELPAGETGELVVSGEHVCRDYFDNPDAFRRAKIPDASGRIWHRTGDVCRLAPDGQLWVLGRVHNTICRAGCHLFPVKPELLLRGLPFVQAAAYVGLPHPQLGEQAVAAFSLRAGVTPADPVAEVARALEAAGIVADRVVQVASVPLDPRHHSKVEYAALRAILASEVPC